MCDTGETCSSCPGDCGACGDVCGDGACTGAETKLTCLQDCEGDVFCGDGACETPENQTTCPADCGPPPASCGDTFCDGTETCTNCPADCGSCGATCGDDICTGTETKLTCLQDCEGDVFCGDTACEGKETAANCPVDCAAGVNCGDGVCGALETSTNCPADCQNTGPVSCNGMCGCESSAPLVSGWGVKVLDHNFDQLTAECPILGGTFGVSLGLKGKVSESPATCPDFKASAQASGSVEAKLHLCKDTFAIEASGLYYNERQYCKNCDLNSCNWQSEQTFCEETGFSGSIGISRSRTFKLKKTLGTSFLGKYGTIEVGADCGAELGITGSLGGGHTAKVNGGCGSCGADCSTYSGELGVEGWGKGSCTLNARVSSWAKSFGCNECIEAKLGVAAKGETSSGGCGSGNCLSMEGSFDATIKTPCFYAPIPFVSVSVQCEAKLNASAGAGTCGASAPTGDVAFECFVGGDGASCQG